MEKLQEIIKEIQELYDTQKKKYIGYCMDRVELDCKDEDDAIDQLLVCSANGDWENLCWEQGHLAGINDGLNIVKEFLKNVK